MKKIYQNKLTLINYNGRDISIILTNSTECTYNETHYLHVLSIHLSFLSNTIKSSD